MPPLTLETFDGDGADRDAPLDSGLEEARSVSYEQGYAAGWEDATRAQSEDQTRLDAEVAHHLQALGFTWQEARTHMLRALEPLLEEMVAGLLPEIAREAVGPVVLAQLMPLAEGLAEAPVILVLHPALRATVEPRLAAAQGLNLTIVEYRNLAEGQVYFRLGAVESRVDLTRATARIAAAVRGFFDLTRPQSQDAAPQIAAERAHG